LCVIESSRVNKLLAFECLLRTRDYVDRFRVGDLLRRVAEMSRRNSSWTLH